MAVVGLLHMFLKQVSNNYFILPSGSYQLQWARTLL